MDRCKCYLCEKLCYCDSVIYDKCEYRRCKSFGVLENRNYEEACTRLAVRFAKKHGWRFEGWVGHFDPNKHNWYEGAGGHAMFNDMVYSFEDIRTDLMMDAHTDAINDYIEQCLQESYAAETENREARYVNYRNWLLGARPKMEDCSPEFLKIKEQEKQDALERMEKARNYLEQSIKDMLQRDADDLLSGSDGLF